MTYKIFLLLDFVYGWWHAKFHWPNSKLRTKHKRTLKRVVLLKPKVRPPVLRVANAPPDQVWDCHRQAGERHRRHLHGSRPGVPQRRGPRVGRQCSQRPQGKKVYRLVKPARDWNLKNKENKKVRHKVRFNGKKRKENAHRPRKRP